MKHSRTIRQPNFIWFCSEIIFACKSAAIRNSPHHTLLQKSSLSNTTTHSAKLTAFLIWQFTLGEIDLRRNIQADVWMTTNDHNQRHLSSLNQWLTASSSIQYERKSRSRKPSKSGIHNDYFSALIWHTKCDEFIDPATCGSSYRVQS